MKGMAEARFITVSLVILVASMVFPFLVQAVGFNVGVKVGDWIKYGQYKVTWNGNGTEPSYVTEEQKADWTRWDVESVSGTTVTLNVTVHYNNGTQISQNMSADVAGTQGMTGLRVLIASNLKAGDLMVNASGSPTINQTTTAIYAGASRDVNLVNVTSVYDNQTTTVRIYWDQATGAMVEMYTKLPVYGNPGAYIETSVKATETNMWSADLSGTLYDNLIYIIAGIIIIAIVVAAAVVHRRKKSSQLPSEPATTVTPPPPPSPTASTFSHIEKNRGRAI
jgi:hypothetical protein